MKLVLHILLILVIIATISICAIQPDLHKNVVVYDSDYTLVPEQEVTTETKDIPIMEMPVKPVETTIKVENKVEPIVNTYKTQSTNVEKQTISVPKQTMVKQTTAQPKVQAQKQAQTQQSQTVTKPVIKQEVVVQKPIAKETVKVEQPKVEKNIVNTPPVQSTPKRVEEVKAPKLLTQQEETIAWNKWRSNLTNSIMQDTKLPEIPNGVLFQFSFTVDKYGKITNVQTGANPANYTPYAIQYIAPVIRSYQGKSILVFPEGTARTVTQVTGKWRISSTEKFSTPQDYNDIERVVR